MTYRIREVDASDDEVADIIRAFNRETPDFPELTDAEFDGFHCYWWLAYLDREPVGFAGLVPSQRYKNTGYLKRAGVTKSHRGHGIQLPEFRLGQRAVVLFALLARFAGTGWQKDNRCGEHAGPERLPVFRSPRRRLAD
jgi:GNAT superfamily N-acetyltransferase